MSVVAMTWVFENSDATLGARLVLLAIADHAHADGTRSFPSVATLAAHTRMSRRAVQAALRKLEDDSHVEQTGRTRTGTTVYSIVGMGGADSAQGEVSTPGEVHDLKGRSFRPRGEEDARNTSSTSPEPSVNHHKTQEDPPSGDGVLEIFDYWREKCCHLGSTLDAKRRRLIAARLRETSPERVRTAIDGAAAAAFVDGRGVRHDDIALICRDNEKLDLFVKRAQGRASSGRRLGGPTAGDANAAAQSWGGRRSAA